MNLSISQIDSARFKMKVGRAFDLTEINHISDIEEFIKSNNLNCLIARISSKETELIHALENSGFRLMEGRIRFIYRKISSKISYPLFPIPEDCKIRPGIEKDDIEQLVRSSYGGYKGHYHKNPIFSQQECDNVYVDWALSSLSNIKEGDYFSVIEKSGNIVAFASGSKADDNSFVGGLLGVDPNERRHGLASVLHLHRLQWCKENHFDSIIVATSLNNWVYQNLLIKLGYEVLDSDLTFHWNNINI